jgi:heme-degrading monooxygenase HmoA
MHLTITSIKLRSLWDFFSLANYALKIVRQTQKEKGLLAFKKTGIGKVHYTLTAWETEDDLKRFARTGAHLEAMKISAKISTEIRTYTYSTDKIPNWKEAKSLLESKGKVLTFK